MNPPAPPPKRVAVIGCGVAGLGAAYTLTRAPGTHVTLYEARAVLGGHANTVDVRLPSGAALPVDTGFLVYNENTYPNLCGLFEELGVPTEPSDMSFSVSLAGRTFEWSSNGLAGLFAQPLNALSPRFHSMLADMQRFNAEAPAFLARAATDPACASLTMRQFLDQGSYGAAFRAYYLLPQVAAVWSASGTSALDFPALTLCRFFVNHSLLQVLDRPVWRTPARRSRDYVHRLAAALPPGASAIRTACAVTAVRVVEAAAPGQQRAVHVTDATGRTDVYDAVVFGAHPDEVLAMLGEGATASERGALGGFQYAHNTAYLHTDADFMPRARSAWASWNYLGKGPPAGAATGAGAAHIDSEPCCVTYWLNRLQNLPRGAPELLVTLNPAPDRAPRAQAVLQTMRYSHPQYTLAACAAQEALRACQGARGLHFAGAYLGYGFHEDGLTAGIRAAVAVTGRAPGWWDAPLYSAPPVASGERAPGNAGAGLPLLGGGAGGGAGAGGLLTVAQAASARASGGPYWVDNLGNGGCVGRATRAVAGAAEARAGAALRAAAAAAAAAAAGAGQARAAPPQLPPRLPQPPSLLGALCNGATQAALAAAAAAAAQRSGALAALLPARLLARLQPPRGTAAQVAAALALPLAGLALAAGAVELAQGYRAYWAAGRAAAAAAAGERAEDAALEAAVLAARSSSSSGGGGESLPLPAELLGACASSSVAGYVLTTLPDDVLHAHGAALALAPSASGKAARAYKSTRVAVAAVRAALSAALKRSGAPAPAAAAATIFTLPVGAYMAAHSGGYTGAPPPLHAPALAPAAPLLSSLLSGASAALRYAAMSPVLTYLRASIVVGCIVVRLPDGSEQVYGDRAAPLHLRARLAVYAWGFFTRVARESDLGLARSFIDGEWGADDLTALFNVFIANRDASALSTYGMWTAWVGLTLNFARFALAMDNSVANSRSNIHAHYDLSNDLFTSFLDPATMMYSCGFFDTRRRRLVVTDLTAPAAAPAGPAPAPAPPPARLSFEETELAVLNSVPAASGSGERVEVLYGGTLEEAQLRKLDHLIARACVSKGDKVLDLGFGWGGLSIRLAETIGCRVVGITLSQEQHDLAVERVRARGLSHLITFEIVDYRVFAEAHKGEFDRILSIEMIEAVGHNYFPSFMASLDKLLAPGGVIALQAITMPEARYAEYLTTTDFINTVIFPGGCCPSLAALTDAMMRNSSLMLNSVDQFALHYGETLRRWRANFNAALASVVRPLGFDDAFIRTWNYYLCYCEAGFSTQTLGLQVLTFCRPNTRTLVSEAPSGSLATPLGPFLPGAVAIPAGFL